MLCQRLAPTKWIGRCVNGQSGSDRCQRIAASPPNVSIEVRAGPARLLDPPFAISLDEF